MKVRKLLSSRNINIFQPNSHLEGCTEALELFLFAFWQGTPEKKAHAPALPLLPRRANCPVIFPQKLLQELPCHLSEQASTGYTPAALTHQFPPRAPVTAAP